MPAAALLVGLACGAGCADNPALPFDPYARPQTIRAISPSPDDGPIARDQTFVIELVDYIDPGSGLTFFNGASLASGGLRATTRQEYRMVDRLLIIRTRGTMEPEFFYDLVLTPEVLGSVSGQPYTGPGAITYLIGDHLQGEDPTLEEGPAPGWEVVAPVFNACNACHADPEWKLTPMTREALVGAPSEQSPGQVLVVPFEPSRSYLMHKILWDYPVREGTAQPPPWAGYDELPRGAQRAIERWIAGGAR